MRQIVLDTETTGLEPKEGHRIIEIGALEMNNRRLTGNHFHRYLNPERKIDKGAQEVHGLSNDFLKDKPLFNEIVDEFLSFIKGAELIIHNAPFDLSFLNHEIKNLNQSHGKIEKHCKIIDTLVLARKLHPGQKNSLDALCKRYNVDNSKRDLHGALLDSRLLAHVYLAMTGGQGKLFSEDSHSSEHHTMLTTELSENLSNSLKIVHATPEELEEHNKRLTDIQNNSKNGCLWLN